MTRPADTTQLRSRVSVSVATTDTETCLAALRQLAEHVGSAEVRLDLMDSFSVPEIVENSPVPLVLTCRPTREGGNFSGSEDERLDVLRLAYESGVSYIDIEADSVGHVRSWGASPTQVVVSRHWYDTMPTDLLPQYRRLRDTADVVKLVGRADSLSDTMPILELLRDATTPVIALAMGDAGGLTRLIGPCFGSCLLTYGAPDQGKATADGQFTLSEMIETYHLDKVGPKTSVTVHVCTSGEELAAAADRQAAAPSGASLHLAVRVPPNERENTLRDLSAVLPGVQVVAGKNR